jgi:hypothetical protein
MASKLLPPQEKSGLLLRVPLTARTVKEVSSPRGFEFVVNQKRPVIKLQKINVLKGWVVKFKFWDVSFLGKGTISKIKFFSLLK